MKWYVVRGWALYDRGCVAAVACVACVAGVAGVDYSDAADDGRVLILDVACTHYP